MNNIYRDSVHKDVRIIIQVYLNIYNPKSLESQGFVVLPRQDNQAESEVWKA